jgi:hypothetical protein
MPRRIIILAVLSLGLAACQSPTAPNAERPA